VLKYSSGCQFDPAIGALLVGLWLASAAPVIAFVFYFNMRREPNAATFEDRKQVCFLPTAPFAAASFLKVRAPPIFRILRPLCKHLLMEQAGFIRVISEPRLTQEPHAESLIILQRIRNRRRVP
jgi:hypothetical protein